MRNKIKFELSDNAVKALEPFKDDLMKLCFLRTFPNRFPKEMNLEACVFINQLGKVFESLTYIFREFLEKRWLLSDEVNSFALAREVLEPAAQTIHERTPTAMHLKDANKERGKPMSRICHLVLKRKYFAAIADGRKKIEYRDNTHYWRRRILGRKFIVFHDGYTRTTMKFEIQAIYVGDQIQIQLGKRLV